MTRACRARFACRFGALLTSQNQRATMLAALAIALVAVPLATPAAASAQATAQLAAHPYARLVDEASQRFGIPESWIWNVMRVESGGNARAVSPVGAQGLMQIMPGTWTMLTRRYTLGSDPFDVRANIHAGAAYLRMMWDRYRSVELMLAAYNAGPGRTDAYAAGRRRLPAETIAYVARIAPALGTSGFASPAPVPSRASRPWRDSVLFSSNRGVQSPGGQEAATLRNSAAATAAAPAANMAEASPLSVSPHPLFIPLSGPDW